MSLLQLLTEREAAAYLKLSPRTLERMRGDGLGPRFRKIGGRRVVYAELDLQAYLDSRSFQSTSEYEH